MPRSKRKLIGTLQLVAAQANDAAAALAESLSNKADNRHGTTRRDYRQAMEMEASLAIQRASDNLRAALDWAEENP